jgi:DNA-binding LacI/PurR family transcriptional regulator
MATLADVARLAGVTKATVSYVINKKGRVSEQTRRRVEEAIRLLDYRPNLLARGLADGRTRILALVINSITNPFYAEFADDVQAAARERGYYLLLYSSAQSDHETSQEALSHLYSLIDGLLVTKSAVANSEVQRAAQHAVPVVLCLGWTGAEQAGLFSLVYYDHFRAGKLAAEYLVQLGHRDIGVLLPEGHHSLRLEGFRSALEEAGVTITSLRVIFCPDDTIQSGYRAAQSLLSEPGRPTAVFATNDLLAIGAMDATVDAGLRVPGDLSVVGFDDIQLASQVRPSLTSVALPRKELAVKAIELLAEHIEGKDGKGENPNPLPCQIMLTPHLVVRQSTAPPSYSD